MSARLVQVMAAALVLALVGGGAYAVGASGGGTIRACAKRHGGALRLAKKCRHGERKVSGSSVGPRGRTGPAGATGATGATGPTGAAGTTGAAGSARAYAWVHAAGVGTPSFDAARTSGFTGVSSPHAGYYCLTLPATVDATKVAPQASIVEATAFTGNPEHVYVSDPALESPGYGCSGNAIEAVTSSGTTAGPTPNLDFTVLVP